MKKKRVIFVSALIIGLIVGVVVTARFNLMPLTNAESKEKVLSESKEPISPAIEQAILDENAFIKVAENVGPAVVSISTEHTTRIPGRSYRRPFGDTPFGHRDEFFDRFFKDFFGDMPEREFKQRGLGSGVIIDDAGYILTNEHVVRNADKITVSLSDGRELDGKVSGKDVRSDLAIVKVDGKDLPVAELGDSDKLRIGQWSIAIGNPFGYAVGSAEPTVTVGVVSALERNLPLASGRDRDYSGLIQTDAAINPGNSGGPLVNIRGEVIGINVAIFSTSGGYQGVGFAIPINTAKEIVGSLIEGKKVLYGWLGVNVQEIDEKLAEYFKLKDKQGVLVVKVLPDSPAQKAGLEDGDIIKMFNGKEIKDLRSLLKMVARAEVGTKIKANIIRNGKSITVAVEIGKRPEEISEFGEVSEETWRGLEVSDITKELASRYKFKPAAGVVVTNVEVDSPADQAGIIVGDIIDSINKEQIKNLADYSVKVAKAKGDVLVRTGRGYAVVKAQASE